MFLDVSKASKRNKSKNKQMELIKLKCFFTVKETISKPRRQLIRWEKIFANYIFHNRLTFKTDKEHTTQYKNPNNLIKKWREDLNRHFSKSDIQTANRQMKRRSTLLIIQFSSVAQLCLTLRPHGLQHARPSWTSPTSGAYSNSCPSSWWCHPTISSSVMPHFHLLPPSIFPSIRVFSNELVLHIGWPKYWSFSFSINPSSEYLGLISFRMDWLDLLAVQGTLKSLLQHISSKASILWRSAFFIAQLSHLYTTTGKTIALTRWTFVGKVTSLLFNMLSRLVISFLPRRMCLLISWLQSPSAVILEPPPNKVCHYFHCFPIYLPWSDGTRCHDLSFLNAEF